MYVRMYDSVLKYTSNPSTWIGTLLPWNDKISLISKDNLSQ